MVIENNSSFIRIKKTSQNFSYKKYALLSITIFIIIFCTLGLPYTHWGFKTDDWGNVYHSILSSWHDFFSLFVEGNSEQVYHPTNVPPAPQAFFQGLYRPLSFVYYFFQYCIFGINPYGYFLVTIGLHAVNAVLFFNIISTIIPQLISYCAALLFGFHPSLASWIGWTSAQTYFIELFILLLIASCLKNNITKKQKRWYLIACALFAMNLLLKEQSIFLPALLTVAWRYINPLGFWFVACSYLWIRLKLYPLTGSTGTLTFEPTWQSFTTRIASRFFDFVSYINDMIGLCWLGNGTQLIKASIILGIAIGCCYGLYKSTKKSWIIFCFFGMVLSSWPALLMHYQPRYLYCAIPWFLAALTLMVPSSLNKRRLGTVFSFCMLLIFFNVCFLMAQLRSSEHVLNTITQAFYSLVNDQQIKNRTLCFLALPPRWFAQGTTQAVWMLRKNNNHQVYQFDILIEPIDGNLLENYVTVSRKNNVFTFTTTNPSLLWFPTKQGEKKTTIDLIIEEQYLRDQPLFVMWDYRHQQFKVVSL